MLIKIAVLALVCLSILEAAKKKDSFEKCPTNQPDICGPNAKCFDDKNDKSYEKYNGPFCRCDDGFVGPPPTCKNCSESSECKDDEFCSSNSGKCLKGCRSYKCADKEYCDIETGECKSGCEDDYRCADNQYCNKDKKCKKGCREYSGCPERKFCDLSTRKCVDGCIRNEDCQTDEYCNQNDKKCQKICSDYSCGDNSKCKGKDHQKHCSCRKGFAQKDKSCQKIQDSDDLSRDCYKFCGSGSQCYKNKNSKVFCYCDRSDYTEDPFNQCTRFILSTTRKPALKPGGENEISLATAAALVYG